LGDVPDAVPIYPEIDPASTVLKILPMEKFYITTISFAHGNVVTLQQQLT
jgi:hypothetical protein